MRPYAVPAGALLAAALLPLIVTGSFYHNVMALMAAYAIAALGLNLLVGVAGQISLGHGAFMAIGGYTSAFLTLKAGLPVWLGVPLGGLLAAVVGFLLGLPALRLHGHFLALATLSFGAAVPQIALKWDRVTGGAMGLSPPRFPSDLSAYWISIAVLGGLVWVAVNIVTSRPGRALLALRDSEVAAQSMGVNLAWAKTSIFAFAAGYAGVAGALVAHLSGFISPLDFNLLVSFQLLASIVVGGLGSIPGSIAGAALITALPFVFSRTRGWASTIEGLAIIAIIAVLPLGLSTIWRRSRLARWLAPAQSASAPDGSVARSSLPLAEPAPATAWTHRPPPAPNQPLLEVRDLSVSFGGVRALQGVSFDVRAGTIHGLIGPNGAGKTTALNCITRLIEPHHGTVHLAGRDLLRLAPHDAVRVGLARTFQNVELCRNLTALDNVLLGLHHRSHAPLLAYAFRLSSARQAEARARAEALELLAAVGCRDVAHLVVQTLPYGVLKRIELARALAARPRLLILDEVAAGLHADERQQVADLVRRVRDAGVTVLLVEHDMDLVMSVCDRITVLDFGKVIAEGEPAQVQDDPAVISAYLGTEEKSTVAPS